MPSHQYAARFFPYCKLLRAQVNNSEDVRWVRDNLFFGFIIFAVITVVTGLLRPTLWDLYNFVPACWVFGVGLLLSAAVIYARAPWKLYQQQQLKMNNLSEDIDKLRNFKAEVEDREIKLEIARCDREIVRFGTSVQLPEQSSPVFVPTEDAESVRVVFINVRKPGVPGKTAKSVLSRVTYDDPNGRSFTQEGRWADTDQIAILSPLQSKNHLLRVDFEPGAQHHLDIVAKFQDGCYAMNNDPLVADDGRKRGDKKLVGTTVCVKVQLIAECVNQTFRFELRNPVNGQMEIVPV